MVFGIKWIGDGEWGMEAMLRVLGVLLGGVRERAEMRPGDCVGCLWAQRKDPPDVSVLWILSLNS